MYRKGSIFAGKKYLCKVQNPIIAMKHRLLFLLAAVLLGTLPARPQPTPAHSTVFKNASYCRSVTRTRSLSEFFIKNKITLYYTHGFQKVKRRNFS